MSITNNTDTPVIDTTTDAYGDYVACDVNGMTQSARAAERGITPATVNAGIRRVRAMIDAGAAVPDTDGNPTHTVVVPFDAWVGATYGDDAALAASLVGNGIADAMRDHRRASDAYTAAVARMAACDERMTRIGTMFDRATGDDVPSFDDVRAAYDAYTDAAHASDTDTDTDAPDTDAPDTDADASGDDAPDTDADASDTDA